MEVPFASAKQAMQKAALIRTLKQYIPNFTNALIYTIMSEVTIWLRVNEKRRSFFIPILLSMVIAGMLAVAMSVVDSARARAKRDKQYILDLIRYVFDKYLNGSAQLVAQLVARQGGILFRDEATDPIWMVVAVHVGFILVWIVSVSVDAIDPEK